MRKDLTCACGSKRNGSKNRIYWLAWTVQKYASIALKRWKRLMIGENWNQLEKETTGSLMSFCFTCVVKNYRNINLCVQSGFQTNFCKMINKRINNWLDHIKDVCLPSKRIKKKSDTVMVIVQLMMSWTKDERSSVIRDNKLCMVHCINCYYPCSSWSFVRFILNYLESVRFIHFSDMIRPNKK